MTVNPSADLDAATTREYEASTAQGMTIGEINRALQDSGMWGHEIPRVTLTEDGAIASITVSNAVWRARISG